MNTHFSIPIFDKEDGFVRPIFDKQYKQYLFLIPIFDKEDRFFDKEDRNSVSINH